MGVARNKAESALYPAWLNVIEKIRAYVHFRAEEDLASLKKFVSTNIIHNLKYIIQQVDKYVQFYLTIIGSGLPGSWCAYA